MKSLLLITTDRYPNGDAGAVRQGVLSKMISECGYKVDIVGLGDYTDDYVAESEYVKYISLRSKVQTLIRRVKDRLAFSLMAIRLYKRANYDAVLLESVPILLFVYFTAQKRKGAIDTLIHDSVEWYSPSEYKLGRFSLAYILKNVLNTHIINRQFHIIAISRYLENHFKTIANTTVRIPIVYDSTQIHNKPAVNSEKIIFQYAGLMGRKDMLKKFLLALSRHPQKERFEVRLYGFNEDYIIETNNANRQTLENLKGVVTCYGRQPRDKVLESLLQANFSLLFRNPDERYAKAGFPTKAVESLSHGVPLFCNISSDLGLYLRNGVNSVVVEYSEEHIFEALSTIAKMSKDELMSLKVNAQKTAVDNFDFRIYLDNIKQII